MTAEAVAARHAAQQVALGRRAALELARMWRLVDAGSIGASWRALLPQAVAMLGASQATAAAAAAGYVDGALAASGVRVQAAGDVVPGAFAGVASDGRALASLLTQAPINALTLIGRGVPPAQALRSGAFVLDMIARTQVADAGRAADGVAIAARPEVAGYVRMVVGKTCARCLILAGRRYRWNAGFKRHPRCDCRHVPVAEDVPGDVQTDPKAAFRALTEAEQNEAFGKAGARAIRDGADMAKVVNARRGMSEAGGRLFTTEAAGRRPRLMPEQIYRDAANRDDAIRLLRLHGYIR